MIKRKIYSFTVPEDFGGKIRLREFAKGLFPYLETGSAVKKAIQKEQISLNDKIGNTGDWVIAGSTIRFEWSYQVSDQEYDIVNIFYEDDDLLVVRKPPGISSSGNSKSFQLQLQGIRIEDGEDSLPFPYLVHRLDKATEGLMIAAKNISIRRKLAEMISNHEISKEYVLIIEGHLPASIRYIEDDIDGKPAKTEILKSISLDTKHPTSKVYVRLHTGRTHQIRKHFSALGFPIVGDSIYNNGGLTFGTGLLLCAYLLEFVHPITHETITVEYPIPKKIGKYRAL